MIYGQHDKMRGNSATENPEP